MGQKVITHTVSDVTGTVIPDGEVVTVTLAYGGKSYRLDLTDAEAHDLDTSLAPFLKNVAPTKNHPASTGKGKQARTGPDPAKIREWANNNGHRLSSRGRIPESVRAEYEAAH